MLRPPEAAFCIILGCSTSSVAALRAAFGQRNTSAFHIENNRKSTLVSSEAAHEGVFLMFSMCWSGLDQRSWSRPVFAAGQLRARLALRASRAYYASWPKASLLFVMLSEGQHDSRALDWPKASLVRPKIIKEQAGRRPACVASSGGRRPPDL